MSWSSDLRYVLRALRKSPTFLVAAVGTLALSIGATTAIFSVVNGILLRPLPFPSADRLVVLRDGRVAGERGVAETTPDEAILLIVGREPSQAFRRPAERRGSPRLALQSLAVDQAGPVDCEIHAGEIVGLVGLNGAGQESIGRALFGLAPVRDVLEHVDGLAALARLPLSARGGDQIGALQHGMQQFFALVPRTAEGAGLPGVLPADGD